MKKLIIFALILSLLTAALLGCNKTPDQFKGQWKFAKISKVEIASHVSESTIAELMEQYGAQDKTGVEERALAAFVADKTFDSCYLNF